jgi:DNA-binding Lrp family transcriptional regulator
LAARTHWHESTVRRRVEELIASGVLFFDLDLASDAFGIRAQALLWMSVAHTNLRDVGQALASRPEFPFVAATTGSTNLVAALVCPDDRSLYEYLTGEMTALDGLTHIETAPVMQFVKMHSTPPWPRSNHDGSDGRTTSDLAHPRRLSDRRGSSYVKVRASRSAVRTPP